MRHATLSERKLGFRIHAIVFVPAVALLVFINLLTGSPYWSVFAMAGWGIGLLSHWWFVLGPDVTGETT